MYRFTFKLDEDGSLDDLVEISNNFEGVGKKFDERELSLFRSRAKEVSLIRISRDDPTKYIPSYSLIREVASFASDDSPILTLSYMVV